MEDWEKSKLWVYTSTTDLLFSSPSPQVQQHYFSCLQNPLTPYHTVTCTLQYLLEETHFTLIEEKPGKIYLLPFLSYAKHMQGKRILVGMQADRCSLGLVIAVGDANTLSYGEAARIVEKTRAWLIPLLPREHIVVIDYYELAQLVKTINVQNKTIIEAILSKAVEKGAIVKKLTSITECQNPL